MQPNDAKVIKEEIGRAQQGFTRQSATVVSYRPFAGKGGIATVIPDGPGAGPIEAPNTTGVNLNPNDRVMLDFDPPAGVYILGVVTTPASTASCEPEAVRCHVTLGCGGMAYYPDTGDYEIVASIDPTLGLLLPDPGVWHIGFNLHSQCSTGFHMGQGRMTVSDLGCTYDYGITTGNEDDTVTNWVTSNGAVDHAVPPNTIGAYVSVDAWGGVSGTGLPFLSGFIGLLYAHRIECTADLLDDGDFCG